VEGPSDDPRKRTGFGLAVEEMFHELVNQIGQVKEMARQKREEQLLAEAAEEEREFLEEEETSFFNAVEKMFHDIRESFSQRIHAIKEQEKEVEEKLEKTRIALEIRQNELERLRQEMETARTRTSELEHELHHLRTEASKVDQDYVQSLEGRLNDAYGLLKTIEETYLAVEGGSF
jgi:chromosome segregation ATPase